MIPIVKRLILSLALFCLLTAEPAGVRPVSAQEAPPVLAFYYAWFDHNTWSSGQATDSPLEPYQSADRATIERQVSQAQSAGIDALVQSWYGPSENPTETNFRTLLDVAQARGFRAAVDFEVTGPFFGDSGAVTGGLATLLATHAQHPAYFRYQGKPVIFFWRQQRFSVEAWAAIRNQVDPNRDSYWIAEGTDISYQAVFDGHHLYSIAWAGSPAAQLLNWGNRVRGYEADQQVNRLWVATIMPGYDDTRLPRSNAFAVPRRGGDYYRETWQGALASQPDMLILTSFNEWLEGTQIEPSVTYGNLYLDVTRELVTSMRGSPPPAPVAAAAVQEVTPTAAPPTPTGPYIRVQGPTNVRSGPGTDFDRVGQLPAGSLIPVTGQVERGAWWQVEFEQGPDGTGWISGEVSQIAGETAAVPVLEAPTPATPSAGPTPTSTARPTGVAVAQEPLPTATDLPAEDSPQVEVTAGEVNVRSGPGLNFEQVGLLPENSSAPVIGRNETGDWWQVEFPAAAGGQGWVADAVVDFVGDRNSVPVTADRVVETPTNTPTPTPTVPVIAGTIEVLEPINVRDAPSVEGALIGGLYLGDSANVLAISEDGEWWQVEFEESPDSTGWVAAEFVRFQGDRAGVPIFGAGTATPTPSPTDTPTPTPPGTPTPQALPTFAPTATSVYQATAAALLQQRGTPDPSLREGLGRRSGFDWGAVPWGMLSIVVVAAFLWYQFVFRRRI